MAGRLDFHLLPHLLAPVIKLASLFNHLLIWPMDKTPANHDRKPHPGLNNWGRQVGVRWPEPRMISPDL